FGDKLVCEGERLNHAANGIRQALESAKAPRPTAAAPTNRTPRPAPQSPLPSARPTVGDGRLPKAERLILTALAQHGACNKSKVALVAGYAVGGGGFGNAMSALRTKGLLEGSGDNLRITRTGLDMLGPFDPLPTGEALVQHWLGQLGKAER